MDKMPGMGETKETPSGGHAHDESAPPEKPHEDHPSDETDEHTD
jgi:hypothetical protein